MTNQYQIPGTNTMLMGASGSGKTHAIRTLVEAGIETFVIFTEPGMEVLADVPADKLHWRYIAPTTPDWSDMLDSANKINKLGLKALSEMSDINKSKYREFMDVLGTCANFRCDRTGEEFGDISTWTGDRALVLDSLTGLSIMAMNMVTGSKPVKSMADWGMAIDNLERLIIKLCVDTQCHFVMTAHLEREIDETTGGSSLMAATLGRKLAPKLPRWFSDVVHVKREGTKHTWSTATTNVDAKTRYLQIADNLTPSFGPIISNWRKRAASPQIQPGQAG